MPIWTIYGIFYYLKFFTNVHFHLDNDCCTFIVMLFTCLCLLYMCVFYSVLYKCKQVIIFLFRSERVSKTNVNGVILNEAKYINSSLHFLELVIVLYILLFLKQLTQNVGTKQCQV